MANIFRVIKDKNYTIVNNDYLIINCQEALAKRGIKAVVTH